MEFDPKPSPHSYAISKIHKLIQQPPIFPLYRFLDIILIFTHLSFTIIFFEIKTIRKKWIQLQICIFFFWVRNRREEDGHCFSILCYSTWERLVSKFLVKGFCYKIVLINKVILLYSFYLLFFQSFYFLFLPVLCDFRYPVFLGRKELLLFNGDNLFEL